MKSKYLAGFLLLGCVVGLAVGRGQNFAPQATLRPTPAILAAACYGGGTAGKPYAVLGQFDFSCADFPGVPSHGVPMPSPGTLQNLHVTGYYNHSAEQGGVLTVYVNGTATAITCTVDASGKCADITHKVVVKTGDEVASTYTSPMGSLDVGMSLEKR